MVFLSLCGHGLASFLYASVGGQAFTYSHVGLIHCQGFFFNFYSFCTATTKGLASDGVNAFAGRIETRKNRFYFTCVRRPCCHHLQALLGGLANRISQNCTIKQDKVRTACAILMDVKNLKREWGKNNGGHQERSRKFMGSRSPLNDDRAPIVAKLVEATFSS